MKNAEEKVLPNPEHPRKKCVEQCRGCDRMFGDSWNYPLLKVDGNVYYIPNPKEALKFGFFHLEDTGKIFKVTGIQKNVLPACLEFEEFTGNMVYQGTMPVAKIAKDVCMAWENPALKWKNYYVEDEMKKVKGKDTKVYYHYNPCLLATHISHSPRKGKDGKLNPLKASKRRNR